ncbi:MAG: hypothetical protein ACKO1F_08785 [Flammeovirgaceae bacterium]
MAKINESIKQTIAQLSKKELENLVLRAAQKHNEFHDYLLITHADPEFGEDELFEKAKADLKYLYGKRYKGFSEELQLANMLAACLKRINEFDKICRNKELELKLIMFVLEVPFSLSTNMFCTCFTAYNHKVYLLLRKAVTILQKKLHEDYRLEYEAQLNEYLSIMHRTSSHLHYIGNLPNMV